MSSTTLPFRAVIMRQHGASAEAVARVCGMTVAQAEAIRDGRSKPIGTRGVNDRAMGIEDKVAALLRASHREYIHSPVSLPIIPGVWPTEATDLRYVRPVAAPLPRSRRELEVA